MTCTDTAWGTEKDITTDFYQIFVAKRSDYVIIDVLGKNCRMANLINALKEL